MENTTEQTNPPMLENITGFWQKVWGNKIAIALAFTTCLTVYTNYEGIYAFSGSRFVAICGTAASIILFIASWHSLAKQDLKAGFRKNTLVLALIGVILFGASVTFSSEGFFKTVIFSSSTEISGINHNISQLENAQANLPNVFQQANKSLNEKIDATKKLIVEKTENLRANNNKQEQKTLRKEISDSAKEIQDLTDKRNELAELKVSDAVTTLNFEKTEEVKTAIQEINAVAQKLITEAEIKEIPEEWKQAFSYQQPKKIDVETAFFQQLKAGETSAWLIFLLAFGIDFVQILSLFAHNEVPILEDRIKNTKSWLYRIIKAIFSWNTRKDESINENDTVEEITNESGANEVAQLIEPVIQPVVEAVQKYPIVLRSKTLNNGKKKIIHLNLDELTDEAFERKESKVINEMHKSREKGDVIGLPDDWIERAKANKPIDFELHELEKILPVSRENKNYLMELPV